MILNDYYELIRENFNLSDSKTRQCIIALEDAEQNQVLSALANALYDKIIKKVDHANHCTSCILKNKLNEIHYSSPS